MTDRFNPFTTPFRSLDIGRIEEWSDTENFNRSKYIIYKYLENTRNPNKPEFRKEFDRSMFSLWGEYGAFSSPFFGLASNKLFRYLMANHAFRYKDFYVFLLVILKYLLKKMAFEC